VAFRLTKDCVQCNVLNRFRFQSLSYEPLISACHTGNKKGCTAKTSNLDKYDKICANLKLRVCATRLLNNNALRQIAAEIKRYHRFISIDYSKTASFAFVVARILELTKGDL